MIWLNPKPKLSFIAASWGVKTHQNREAISKAAKIIFYETEHIINYGFDQSMLNTHLTSLAINDVVKMEFKKLICYFMTKLFLE